MRGMDEQRTVAGTAPAARDREPTAGRGADGTAPFGWAPSGPGQKGLMGVDATADGPITCAVAPLPDSMDAGSGDAPGKEILADCPTRTKMRILVTGGAGFIGSHLAEELLRRGHEVRIADSLITGKRGNMAHIPAAEFLEG